MDEHALELQALLNGEVERFTFTKYFTFMVDGDEAIFTADARAFIEGALSCTLIETVVGGALVKLSIPEKAKAKAERLLQCAMA